MGKLVYLKDPKGAAGTGASCGFAGNANQPFTLLDVLGENMPVGPVSLETIRQLVSNAVLSVGDHLKYPEAVYANCLNDCQREALAACWERTCCTYAELTASAEDRAPWRCVPPSKVICILDYQWKNQFRFYSPCGCTTSAKVLI